MHLVTFEFLLKIFPIKLLVNALKLRNYQFIHVKLFQNRVVQIFLNIITTIHSTMSIDYGEKVTKFDRIFLILIFSKIHASIKSYGHSIFIIFPDNSFVSADNKTINESTFFHLAFCVLKNKSSLYRYCFDFLNNLEGFVSRYLRQGVGFVAVRVCDG